MSQSMLSILKFPDPILRKTAKSIDKITPELRRFIDHLIKTMKSQPGGIGIAATQVGVLKRIAIVDVSPKIPERELKVLINPVVLKSEKGAIFREGCMSLPDYTANVNRAEEIFVRYQDLELKRHELWVSGLEARCIQHEVDHLSGMLFVDRVASLKSDVFRRRKYL